MILKRNHILPAVLIELFVGRRILYRGFIQDNKSANLFQMKGLDFIAKEIQNNLTDLGLMTLDRFEEIFLARETLGSEINIFRFGKVITIFHEISSLILNCLTLKVVRCNIRQLANIFSHHDPSFIQMLSRQMSPRSQPFDPICCQWRITCAKTNSIGFIGCPR